MPISITNAKTGAAICDATAVERLPNGGTTTLPVVIDGGETPSTGDDGGGDSGPPVTCSDATFAPDINAGESATVTVSAPGFQSTRVTITYEAADPSKGACCAGFSVGNVALAPQ